MKLAESPQSTTTSRLSERERELILQSVQSLAQRKEPVGVCAYGSRIAGYAKEGSDYDVLVALPGYRARVRYKYLKGEIDISALLVDSKALVEDAKSAYLGEFVAGRLLNVFEALTGEEYIHDVELIYKKRVAIEALNDVVSNYHQFAQALIIPPEYFLFEKLKKRATIYPPALFSYCNTYSGSVAQRNLEAGLAGFRQVFSELEDEGVISVEDKGIRVCKDAIKRHQFSRISSIMTYTARGIAQYAVHGYAGRVGPRVVGKELLSKITRTKDIGEPPDLLKHPKSVWQLDEGLLVVECDDWFRRLKDHLGLTDRAEVLSEQVGDIYSTTKIYRLKEGDSQVAFAVKRFRDVKSFKWAALNIWTLTSKRFDTTPESRMFREYSFLRRLRTEGFNTPRVIATFLNDRILVIEFIEGDDLGTITSDLLSGRSQEFQVISKYGELLAGVHSLGYTIGDTKPSNAIYTRRGIYLTDLEQAGEDGDRPWDIAEFLYFSLKFTSNAELARKVASAFVSGYLKLGEPRNLEKALTPRYFAPFGPIVTPKVARAVRDEVLLRIKNST